MGPVHLEHDPIQATKCTDFDEPRDRFNAKMRSRKVAKRRMQIRKGRSSNLVSERRRILAGGAQIGRTMRVSLLWLRLGLDGVLIGEP